MLNHKAVIVVCLLALSLGACSSGDPTAPAAELATPTPRPAPAALEKPTYTVQRGEVADELKLLGRVSATLDEDVFFTQDGFVKTLFVKSTDIVTKGQLLAELDLGTLPNQLSQAQVALDSAQLSLERNAAQQQFAIKRAALDLEDAQANVAALRQPPKAVDIETAQVALRRAQIELEDTRHASSAAKTQAELAIDQAANKVRDKQAAYARIVELNGTKPAGELTLDQVNAQEQGQREIEDAQSALEAAKVNYQLAQQNEISAIADGEQQIRAAQLALDKLQIGPDKQQLADAQRAVRRAQVTLEEARSGGADPEEQNKVEQARLDVESLTTKIEAGRIYAPFEGEVSEVSVRAGDSVAAYKTVLNLINPTDLDLVVEGLLSGDLAKVGVGQQVNVSFSRYPTQVFSGTVEKLPTSLTSTSSTVEADPAIHFSFDRAGLELEVGDLANILLTLKREPAALWLPPQAVRTFDSRRFVVVQDGTRQRRVDVKVGIVSTDRIEILEGLKEGDIVVGQ